MEIFFKTASKTKLEIVDLQYPQYCFVFDEWSFSKEDSAFVAKVSVLQSESQHAQTNDGLTDDFLDNHAKKIIEELMILAQSKHI